FIYQFLEERDHRTARAYDIAVPHDRERSTPRSADVVARNEKLVGDKLGGAVQIDRIGGLVRRERNDALDAIRKRRMNHVLRAMHVRLDAFHGVVPCGWDLLERCGMDDHVHALHGHDKPLAIAYTADEEAHAAVFAIGELLRHLVLLEFV